MVSKEMTEVVSSIFKACDVLRDEIVANKSKVLIDDFNKRVAELAKSDEKVVKPFVSFYVKSSDDLVVKLGKFGGVTVK